MVGWRFSVFFKKAKEAKAEVTVFILPWRGEIVIQVKTEQEEKKMIVPEYMARYKEDAIEAAVEMLLEEGVK